MNSVACRSRCWWSLVAKGRLTVNCSMVLGARGKNTKPTDTKNKPLKQWTLIVSPLGSLRVRLPCNVRVRPQDPLAYPDADRVFVMVSGVDRNVHRGLDLDNIEVKYNEESRQVLIYSENIDSQTCVDVTTPVRFNVNIKTSGTGSVNVKQIECDNCQIETEKGDSVLHAVKGHNVHIVTKGGKVRCVGTVHGNVDIQASSHSTVDIEKLLGNSINICTEDGRLKAKYLYAQYSSMSSTAGDILLGSTHGDTKLHTERGNITVDSSDGCLTASTHQGAIDVYVSQAGKVHLKSDQGSITVKIPATLQASLQLSGAKVEVSPEVHLQEIQNTSREDQATVTGSLNLGNEKEKLIEAEAKRGTVSLKQQDWLQSLKLQTT
ncbi:protein FAM185A [Spea bombifrons]|uniref:protein FAM185A n=1 Tax=Spea bombifrons TaxID=233779 RepID=UPI00234BAA1A|nr:protein FAM185A [Spea bombifrons]